MTCNESVTYKGGQYTCTSAHRLAVGEHSNLNGKDRWLYWHYDQHGEPVVVAVVF